MSTDARNRLPCAAALALALLAAAPAQAALVEISVTGVVTFVSPVPALAMQFSVGQPMTASFTYDSDTPEVPSLVLTRATYLGAVTGGSISVGSYSATTSSGRVNTANDDPEFNDRIRFSNFPAAGASFGTHDPLGFLITLADDTMAALGDLDLPLALPALSSFTERSWELTFTPIALLGIEQTRVEGRLLGLTLTVVPGAVPAPPTPALLLAGVAALLLARRGAGSRVTAGA
jgi:hypothetical protein